MERTDERIGPGEVSVEVLKSFLNLSSLQLFIVSFHLIFVYFQFSSTQKCRKTSWRSRETNNWGFEIHVGTQQASGTCVAKFLRPAIRLSLKMRFELPRHWSEVLHYLYSCHCQAVFRTLSLSPSLSRFPNPSSKLHRNPALTPSLDPFRYHSSSSN